MEYDIPRIPSLLISRQARPSYPFSELYTKIGHAAAGAKIWVIHILLPEEVPMDYRERMEVIRIPDSIVLLDYVLEGKLLRSWWHLGERDSSRGTADVVIYKPEPTEEFNSCGYKFRDWDDYGIHVSRRTFIHRTGKMIIRLKDIHLCFASPILMWQWMEDFVHQMEEYMSINTYTRMIIAVNSLRNVGEAMYQEYKKKYERMGWKEGEDIKDYV